MGQWEIGTSGREMAVPVGTEGSTVMKQFRRRKGCLWETDEMLREEK